MFNTHCNDFIAIKNDKCFPSSLKINIHKVKEIGGKKTMKLRTVKELRENEKKLKAGID